jgi:hypothetical protein
LSRHRPVCGIKSDRVLEPYLSVVEEGFVRVWIARPTGLVFHTSIIMGQNWETTAADCAHGSSICSSVSPQDNSGTRYCPHSSRLVFPPSVLALEVSLQIWAVEIVCRFTGVGVRGPALPLQEVFQMTVLRSGSCCNFPLSTRLA